MIISTRESKAVREKVLPLGVSQISGASRTSVGGYDVPETEDEVTSAQFDVSDQRSLDEIVNWLMGMGDTQASVLPVQSRKNRMTVLCLCAKVNRFPTAAIPMR